MVHDRHYMRNPERQGPPITYIFLGVLVVCYIAQVCARFYSRFDPDPVFGFSWSGLKALKLWQLVTYQLLHDTKSPWHILLNGFVIFFFGREIERLYGAKTFLLLQFGGGALGAVVQLLSLALPSHADGPVIGASGGAFTLLATYATLFPDQELTAFITVIPVQLRARWILYGALGYSFYRVLVPSDRHVADGAHLGGILFGIAAVKLGWLGEFESVQWRDVGRDFFARFKRRSAKQNTPGSWRANTNVRRVPNSEEEYIAREVDPILEKISTHGIQSLTSKEKQILEAARKKMAKR